MKASPFKLLPRTVTASVLCWTALWGNPMAQETEDALEQAFAGFRHAIETGDVPRAIELADEALQLSLERFGRDNENTAALKIHYGAALAMANNRDGAAEAFDEAAEIYTRLFGPDSIHQVEVNLRQATLMSPARTRLPYVRRALEIQQANASDDRLAYADVARRGGALLVAQAGELAEAERMLTEALEIVESEHGEHSERLIPILVELADARAEDFNHTRQMRTYQRAMDILARSRPNDTVAQADLALRAARQILTLSISDGGERFLRSAHRTYNRQFGTDHPKTAEAALAYGELEFSRRRYRQAERHLKEALPGFADLPAYTAQKLRALGLLTVSLEQQRKSEEATAYLLALAEFQPWHPEQEYLPVFRVAPQYPVAARDAGREGYVVLEFTVDETGRVRDLVVLDLEGPESFQEAARSAVLRFRYVPRFEDGVPVATPGVRHLFSFRLAN